MRALLLIGSIGLLAGCVELDDPITLDDGGCWFFPGPCATNKHPFVFLEETPKDLALGGEAKIDYIALSTLTFDVVSNDPAVVTVENRGRGAFVMHAVGLGYTTISARAADGTILEKRSVYVAEIASVAFGFAPAGDTPQSKLAALPGARERIRVLPRTSYGVILAGADQLLDVSFTGDLIQIDPKTAQLRLGQFRILGATPPNPGYDIAVGFGALGGGSITASRNGVELGTLLIDIIPAARDVELKVSDLGPLDSAPGSSSLAAGLVGRDASGVPVVGLVGDFTATPPGMLSFYSPATSRGEVWVLTNQVKGDVTLTATLPDRVLSKTIKIL